MHTIKDMTETIRIPNIEKYTQEIVNGELVLKPKITVKKSTFEKKVDKLIKECNIQGKVFILKKIEKNMREDYNNEGKRIEMYESEISEIAETLDTDDKREWLKKLVVISWAKMEEIKELRRRLFGDT